MCATQWFRQFWYLVRFSRASRFVDFIVIFNMIKNRCLTYMKNCSYSVWNYNVKFGWNMLISSTFDEKFLNMNFFPLFSLEIQVQIDKWMCIFINCNYFWLRNDYANSIAIKRLIVHYFYTSGAFTLIRITLSSSIFFIMNIVAWFKNRAVHIGDRVFFTRSKQTYTLHTLNAASFLWNSALIWRYMLNELFTASKHKQIKTASVLYLEMTRSVCVNENQKVCFKKLLKYKYIIR